MLDTLKGHARTSLSESEIASLFSNIREHCNPRTGEFYYTGNFRGMRCKVYPDHVIIEGSLAKFGQGHNVFGQGYEGDKKAILELCELLHVNPAHCNLWRIDFGTSLRISAEPRYIMPLLGERPKFHRHPRPSSITYTQNQHQQRFYDKVQETERAIKHGKLDPGALPEGLLERDLLRVETSLMQSPKKQLSVRRGDGRCLTLEDVLDRDIYAKIVALWERDYFAVQKHTIRALKGKPCFSGVRGMSRYLEFEGMRKCGMEKLHRSIEAEADKKNRQRMRARLRKLEELQPYTKPSPLILELDQKVREAAIEAVEG